MEKSDSLRGTSCRTFSIIQFPKVFGNRCFREKVSKVGTYLPNAHLGFELTLII